MSLYQNLYQKYKSKYNILKTQLGGNSVNIYLVLVGDPLRHPPDGCSLLSNVPENEFLLGFMQSDPDKHIYKLPVIQALEQLEVKWRPLQNSLHHKPTFERDLTRLEVKYLELVKSQNPRVEWDTSRNWSGEFVGRGTGVVGVMILVDLFLKILLL